jgi:CubicO group peptidase (beta-lactamase class C family)
MTMTPTTFAPDPDISNRLDAIVLPLAPPGGPGAAVIVLKNGDAIYKKAVGHADVDAKVPNTPATNFRLASVTKQLTAAAILLLVDDGKLSLDTRLVDAFPGFPEYGKGITIRHLLTHTSGLPDYEDHAPPSATAQLKDADVLAILAAQSKTYFPAGTQHRYSNSAYALLALVAEKYSGKRFPDFLRDRIFAPLGMHRTVAHEEGITTVADRAFGHSPSEAGGYARTDQSRDSAVLGDGGVYSSVEDLAKWDRALRDGKLLRPETRAAAFAPTVLPDGAPTGYGFGWRAGTYRDHPFVGHGGDSVGFRTHIERYPADGLTVIVLFNRADVDPHQTLRRIVDACLFHQGK